MRNMYNIVVPSILLFAWASVSSLAAAESSGWVAAQGQYFPSTGAQGQETAVLSLAAQPEFYHAFADSAWESTLELFGRWDQEDEERSHVDIREAHALGIYENWEFKFGISKEYWGATEFAHLVDVINQTDIVENIDGEDKLGQPMLKASWYRTWGSIETFILPYFRERNFPGVHGRFITTPQPVNIKRASYESSAEEWHTDAAVRFNGAFDRFDLGVAAFVGTSRDPLIYIANNEDLIPHYEQMSQYSVDFTMPVAQWLIKAEGLYRDATSDSYSTVTGGFEYTQVGVMNSDADLGILAEYIWDERGQQAMTFLQNDIFVGLRLSMNDTQDTALLFGVVQDLDDSGYLLNLEFERRLNDSFKIEVQARAFEDAATTDPVYAFRRDDYIQVEIFFNY
ncbi:MAG: hypothetical protein HRU15_05335 [Planctomycetes bacterium]|nr:hypothetical protein [Planctomycetota bacterium]